MAKLKIIDNIKIKENIYRIRLEAESADKFIPGQFVHLSVGNTDGMLLKRPISVNDIEGNIITLIYEVKGRGTAKLSGILSGTLDALYFQGKGFQLQDNERKVMLIGGGMGVVPLMSALKYYKDKLFYAYLGFSDKDKMILIQEYSALCNTLITTDNGSYGSKGFVTDYAKADLKRVRPDVVIACGPKPMLKALQDISGIRVLVSVEERMGCGMGACLTCTCDSVDGNRRVCVDGPVFDIRELVL